MELEAFSWFSGRVVQINDVSYIETSRLSLSGTPFPEPCPSVAISPFYRRDLSIKAQCIAVTVSGVCLAFYLCRHFFGYAQYRSLWDYQFLATKICDHHECTTLAY